MLTEKQKLIYKTIETYINEFEDSPTIRELCNLCCVKSTATMFVHLKKMESKGYISYLPHKGRGNPRYIILERKLED